MNVVWLNSVKEARKIEQGDPAYQKRIQKMDKLELLEEMMRFQEERTQAGHLTLPLILRGQILFKALEERAETRELTQLARSYRKHLKLELERTGFGSGSSCGFSSS